MDLGSYMCGFMGSTSEVWGSGRYSKDLSPITKDSGFDLKNYLEEGKPMWMVYSVDGVEYMLNSISKGGKTLTEEQMQEMKEKFPDGVNSGNYLDYIGALSGYGVISADRAMTEINNFLFSTGRGDQMLTKTGTFEGAPISNPGGVHHDDLKAGDIFEYLKKALMNANSALALLQKNPYSDLATLEAAMKDCTDYKNILDIMTSLR